MPSAGLLSLGLAAPTGFLFGTGYGAGVRFGYEDVYPTLKGNPQNIDKMLQTPYASSGFKLAADIPSNVHGIGQLSTPDEGAITGRFHTPTTGSHPMGVHTPITPKKMAREDLDELKKYFGTSFIRLDYAQNGLIIRRRSPTPDEYVKTDSKEYKAVMSILG